MNDKNLGASWWFDGVHKGGLWLKVGLASHDWSTGHCECLMQEENSCSSRCHIIDTNRSGQSDELWHKYSRRCVAGNHTTALYTDFRGTLKRKRIGQVIRNSSANCYHLCASQSDRSHDASVFEPIHLHVGLQYLVLQYCTIDNKIF